LGNPQKYLMKRQNHRKGHNGNYVGRKKIQKEKNQSSTDEGGRIKEHSKTKLRAVCREMKELKEEQTPLWGTLMNHDLQSNRI